MSAYRRDVSLNHGPAQVFLGRLDAVNGAARYAFPTAHAAMVFAIAHKARHEHRAVVVDHPDRGTVVITLQPVSAPWTPSK
jgi:hypothetical protein